MRFLGLFVLARLGLSFSHAEGEFLLQFLQRLGRSSCILIDDSRSLKDLARNFIFSSYLPARDFTHSLTSMKSERRAVLLLRESDFRTFHTILDGLTQPRFVTRFTWIVLSERDFDFRGARDIPYDCEFFVAERTSCRGYRITELYTERKSFALYRKVFGTWTEGGGLNVSAASFFQRRMDLEGYPLDAVVMQEKCRSRLQCAVREVWSDISRHLNFTTRQFTISRYESREERWDVLLEPVTHSFSFDTKAISPIWKFPVYMHLRHSADQEFTWVSFFSAFDGDFLAAFSLWVLLIILYVTLLDYFQTSKKRFRCSDAVFSVLSWMCNQGGVVAVPSFSMLTFVFMFRLAVLVLELLCTTTLISFLTLKVPHYPFVDFEGFLNNGFYRLGAEKESLIQYYFEFSHIPRERVLWDKFVSFDEMPASIEEGAERMCAFDNFVFLTDEKDFPAAKRENCSILRIPQPALFILCEIMIDRQSPFEFVLNFAYGRFVEVGVSDRIKHSMYAGAAEEERRTDAITVHQVDPLLSVVELGFLLGFAVCCGEILLKAAVGKWRKLRRLPPKARAAPSRRALRFFTFRS